MPAGAKIAIDGVYKIFGPKPASVLERVKQGISKQALLEETGHTLGLREINLAIPGGEISVIMGLSGSGKSTLLRHINRLIEPTAGRIMIDGADVMELKPRGLRDLRRNKISMVFQRFALLPHKTVLQNVISGLQIRHERSFAQRLGLGDREAADQPRARAMQQIEAVGLEGFENQYPSQLSGGMQQRVGLARALATDTEVLLMDEAFSALDPVIRSEMQDQLLAIQEQLKRTIVFITHDLDEALRLGAQIAILNEGELRQVGTPMEILLHPADDYVARFVADVNRGRVLPVSSVASEYPVVQLAEASFDEARAVLDEHEAVFVVDEDQRPLGAVTRALLDGDVLSGKPIDSAAVLIPVRTIEQGAMLEQAMPLVEGTDAPLAVVDEAGRLVGGAEHRALLKALVRDRRRARRG